MPVELLKLVVIDNRLVLGSAQSRSLCLVRKSSHSRTHCDRVVRWVCGSWGKTPEQEYRATYKGIRNISQHIPYGMKFLTSLK